MNVHAAPDRLDDFEGGAQCLPLELIAESIPHIVWVARPDGSTGYVNQQGVAFTGQSAEANSDWKWLAFVHPDDAARARSGWEHATRTETPFHLEYRLRRYDGQYRWHEYRGLPIRDERGTVVGWIGTATDIEEAKQAAAQLGDSRRQMAETLTLLETWYSNAPVGFAFVDRDFRIMRMNERLAEVNGAPLDEQVGRKVSEVVPQLWPRLEQLYRLVLETGEPVLDVELDKWSAEDPERLRHSLSSFYPVSLDDEVIGIGVVAVDITERRRAELARTKLTRAAVDAVAATIEARDPYTAGHQSRVATMASAIAAKIGVGADEIEGIALAAHIHDIGKIGIPGEILNRPTALRVPEWELIKTHPAAGADIIRGIDFPWPVAEMIEQHHERLDGSGYPLGLKGDEICLGARIIAVADVVEAMASHRPYRAARGIEAAIEEVVTKSGELFDPAVVDACVQLVRDQRFEFDEPG